MIKPAVFAYSIQGASHIRREKESENIELNRKFPCQDRSFAHEFLPLANNSKEEIELFVKNNSALNTVVKLPVLVKAHKTPFKLICVCDGHGGAPYFRSEKGAEFAIQSIVELLSESIDTKFLVAMGERNLKAINAGLSKGLVDRWNAKVNEHLKSNSIEKELELLEKEDKTAFEQYKEGIDLNSIYGCTVIAYFETETFWYAFQIGDGDLAVSFDEDGSNFIFPIPEDPKCFLNETTSICNKDARKDMRFAKTEYLDKKPLHVFCSSDGVGNSFAGEDFLKKFYFNITEMLNSESNIEWKKNIPSGLSELSESGSGDDVSIAGISFIDELKLRRNLNIQDNFTQGMKLFKNPSTKNKIEGINKIKFAALAGNKEAKYQFGIIALQLITGQKAPTVKEAFLKNSYDFLLGLNYKDSNIILGKICFLYAQFYENQKFFNSAKEFYEKAAKLGNQDAIEYFNSIAVNKKVSEMASDKIQKEVKNLLKPVQNNIDKSLNAMNGKINSHIHSEQTIQQLNSVTESK